MTPDQLISFSVVAEHGNISRAAVALHLSQPAVSGQLKQLQDEFGEPLYQREGRGIRLTAAGEQLAEYAAQIRRTFSQAQAFRNALRGMESGTLRVGASTTPASYVLPYLIAEFRQRYPEVAIHTVNGNSTDIIAGLGTLDIAMIEGPEGFAMPPGTGVTAWLADEIVAIAPNGHPLAEQNGPVTLDALCAFPVVLREAGSGVRQLVERACARSGTVLRVALEIAGVEGVKEAVRAGMGIGFVSAMSMRHEDHALAQFSIAPQPLVRRFSILMPHAAAPSRVAARFHALCLDRYSENS